METITTRKQLREFRDREGLRPDWHEPDEQDVSALYARNHGADEVSATALGCRFDNAHLGPGRGEAGIYLFVGAKPVAFVNLAALFALASGEEAVG